MFNKDFLYEDSVGRVLWGSIDMTESTHTHAFHFVEAQWAGGGGEGE